MFRCLQSMLVCKYLLPIMESFADKCPNLNVETNCKKDTKVVCNIRFDPLALSPWPRKRRCAAPDYHNSRLCLLSIEDIIKHNRTSISEVPHQIFAAQFLEKKNCNKRLLLLTLVCCFLDFCCLQIQFLYFVLSLFQYWY